MEEAENRTVRLSLGRETRQLLKGEGLKAKKSLGQHFLVDGKALGKIVTAGRVTRDDTILEVGPGLGVLTRELALAAKQVICIEIDTGLSNSLETRLSDLENVKIVNRDILDIKPGEVLPPGETVYKVIANLPYYITSAVLRHFLESSIPPHLMVVMVQKEVAKQIAARPGKMSLLSVGVQLYGRAEIVAGVPARSFHPVPKVDSAIVRVTGHTEALLPVKERDGFFRIVRAGFGSPRKQLINTLSHGLGAEKDIILDILLETGIEPTRRAESLSVEDWCHLWQVFQAREGEGRCLY